MTIKRLFEATGLRSILQGANQAWNRVEFDAFIAACALMVQANGETKIEEKQAIIKNAQAIPFLEGYSRNDIATALGKVLDAFQSNRAIARIRMEAALGQIENEATAKMILASVCSIGASDSNFDANEITAAYNIAKAMRLGRTAAQEIINEFTTGSAQTAAPAASAPSSGWHTGTSRPATPAPAPAQSAARPAPTDESRKPPAQGGWVTGGPGRK